MRPFLVVTETQRTPEWHQARVGRLTGTCAAAMLAKGRGKDESVQKRDLRIRLALEQLTGQSAEDEGFVSREMQRGTELEPDAVAEYEIVTGTLIQPVGFVAHPELPAGCSPDGQVGDFTGLVELKCPKSATHFRYLTENRVPPDYLPQITHNAWITGVEWVDFVSFDPRFPEPLRLFVKRITRKELEIPGYALAVDLFLSEVQKELRTVRDLMAGVAA